MGRGQKRGRTQRKHFKEGRENTWKYNNNEKNKDEDGVNPDQNSNPSWKPFATENQAFEEYYKEQEIVPEEEWNEFIHFLRKPLPAAFRINSSGQFHADIQFQLENDFLNSLKADCSSENETEAIRPLPWYPGKLAWHLNFSRMQLRKNQILERFHEFLKLENEIGNITRQEAVSMVPPLFLDVLPDHYVLDMCAAPGSKTFQLLEIMHQSANLGSLPNGLVIANDVDVQRCNLLIHQTKRMCTANLIVTNHEAQHFPSCRLTNSLALCNGGNNSSANLSCQLEKMPNNQLLFDRVLCDVPCSGDGTLRKAPDIWRKWNSGMGNGLHRLQVQIAMRGLTLLKVGGRMVYSTCSMNPIENEAVVAEVLRRCGSSIELLDVSAELPQLIRRQGLKKWKVRDRGIWLDSYEDVPPSRKGAVVPSMFPSCQSSETKTTLLNDLPTDQKMKDVSIDQETDMTNGKNDNSTLHCATVVDVIAPAEDGKSKLETVDSHHCAANVKVNCNYKENSYLPLEHCMRIVPHDQNSGAFFIAVFKKLSSLPDVSSNNPSWNKCVNNEMPKDKCNILKDGIKAEKHLPVHVPINNLQPLKEVSGGNLQHELPCTMSVEDDLDAKSVDTPEEKCYLEKRSSFDVEVGTQEKSKFLESRSQMQGKWRGVDPVLFFRDEGAIKSIKDFYGIDESFPLEGHLVTRNSDFSHVKRIYYVSKSVRDMLELNLLAKQPLKIASLGLKIFERQTAKDAYASSPCIFRISSEGLPLLLPYISKQILYASLTDFRNILKYRNIKFSEFVDSEFGQKASNLLLGCCVVVLNAGDHSTDAVKIDASTIAIGCWKGKTNLSIMVSEMDSLELLKRITARFDTGVLSKEPENNNSEVDETMGVNYAEPNENSETVVGSKFAD